MRSQRLWLGLVFVGAFAFSWSCTEKPKAPEGKPVSNVSQKDLQELLEKSGEKGKCAAFQVVEDPDGKRHLRCVQLQPVNDAGALRDSGTL